MTINDIVIEGPIKVLGISGVGILATLGLVVKVMLAVAVKNDAQKLEKQGDPKRLFLFSPILWGLLCFTTDIPGVIFYWAAHYSSLRKDS
jgi:hypothetical protein